MAQKYFFFIVVACILEVGCLVLPQARAQISIQNLASSNTSAPSPAPGLKARTRLNSDAANQNQSEIPGKALRMYRQAVNELHQGQTAAAAKDAHRAIRIDEGFADAYALAATAALVQRNYPLAQAEAAQAVKIDAHDEKAWVIAATADNYLGLYTEAVAALNHVPQQDSGTWQVAYQRARAEAGQQNVQQALEWTNRAALTAPSTFAPLHLLRASALLAANQNALSAEELGTYLSLIAPDAPEHEELMDELHRLQNLAQSSSATRCSVCAPTAVYNALAN